jgi:hypothetical protein
VLKKIGWTCCFGEGEARARVGHKPDLHGIAATAAAAAAAAVAAAEERVLRWPSASIGGP